MKTRVVKTMELRCQVNGESKRWSIAPGDLLLDVLRREGYFGVKRGCEKGECGACTVLIGGRPVNSCLMFAAQAEGADVLTIEGVAHGDTLDPIQEAFLDHGAVQCGYCTPAMILSAKALLDRCPNPTEEQVCEALAGTFCRCTGYRKPVEAVLAAARVKKKAARDVGQVGNLRADWQSARAAVANRRADSQSAPLSRENAPPARKRAKAVAK